MANELDNVDPFNYSIEQTILALSPYLDENHAQSFRFHEITGRVLLNKVNYSILEHKLGVIPLGRQEGIMGLVRNLRGRSIAYQKYIMQQAQNVPLPEDDDEDLNEPQLIRSLCLPEPSRVIGKRKRNVLPHLSPPPSPPRILNMRSTMPLYVRCPDAYGTHHVDLKPLVQEAEANYDLLQAEAEDQPSSSPVFHDAVDQLPRESGIDGVAEPEIPDNSDEIDKPDGGKVQEEHADLEELAPIAEPSIEDSSDTAMGDSSPRPQTPDEPTRKRLAPTKIAPITQQDDVVMDLCEPESEPELSIRTKGVPRKRYLPVKGRKIDSIFYDVEVGEEIPLEYDSNDEFQMVARGLKFPGENLRIGRRMCRMLKDNGQILEDLEMGFATGSAAGLLTRTTYKGRPRVAIKHYGGCQVALGFRKHEHQSFSVFDVQSKDTIRVHRQTVKSLPLKWPPEYSAGAKTTASDIQIVRHADEPLKPQIELDPNDNTSHDWDYLLKKWQNVDGADEELPPFGESDVEYDLQTWKEIEAEFGPQEKVSGKPRLRILLTEEDVKEAIEDATRELLQTWRQKKLPKLEETAYRLWRRVTKNRLRKLETRKAHDKIEEFEARLDKMKKELLLNVGDWRSKDHVRKTAKGILEVTIYDREEQKWIIDLLARKEKPLQPLPKNPKAPKDGGKAEPNGGGADSDDVEADDEESIGSSSNEDLFSDEDDGMEGFIVSDPEADKEPVQTNEELDLDSEVEDEDKIKTPRRRVVKDSQDDEGDIIMHSPGSDHGDSVEAQIKSEHLTPQATSNLAPVYIDLTADSPPRKPRNTKSVPIINLESDDSTDDSTDETSGFELLKNILTSSKMENEFYHLYFRICDLKEKEFEGWFEEVKIALKSFHKKELALKLSPSEQKLLRTTVRLYTAQAHSLRIADRYEFTVQQRMHLNKIETFRKFTNDVKRIYEMRDSATDTDQDANVQAKGKSDDKKPLDEEEDFDDDTESQLVDSQSSHRKRRRKAVVEDQTSKRARDTHLKIHKNLQKRIDAQIRKGVALGSGRLQVNLGHMQKHGPIYILDELAAVLKPHQVEGVRFLWQTLVQTGLNKGALLAHTMGLGKTLQVITFLYTLAVAGSSSDKKIYEQIPKHLRKSKTLILCPPGLVENWWDEFHNWLPFDRDSGKLREDYIGKIYRADGVLQPVERMAAIKEWHATGGVLLMGFQTFRMYIFRSPNSQISARDQERLREILLEEPNVIVADEAHNLKSTKTALTRAASLFRSKSRIAMTGSPLSNNLLEYWAMIEWIDPRYLGPLTEFKRKYVEPITDGLYTDSSPVERRRSLTMLKVLQKDLSLKVHRADIDVIQSEMPQKTEFMVTVPLTTLQRHVYIRYLEDVVAQGKVKGYFDIVKLLQLIIGHPSIFLERLKERLKVAQKDQKMLKDHKAKEKELASRAAGEEEDIGHLDGDSEEKETEENPHEIQQYLSWAVPLLNDANGAKIEHSYKMLAFREIVKHSVAIKERVLVFSHSILTLDALEKHLKGMQVAYQRLDGKTPMGTRQAAAKKFNVGEVLVFLISTEAGGLGINLPGASRVIIFDFTWSPAWEQQAIGRAYRLGQKNHVFVYRFHAGGTFEDSLWNQAQLKTQLASRVVDLKNPMRAAHKKTQKHLQPPRDVEKCDISDYMGKDPVLDHLMNVGKDYVYNIIHTETFVPDFDEALNEAEQKEVEDILEQERQQRLKQEQEDAAQRARKAAISNMASLSAAKGQHPDMVRLQEEQQKLFDASRMAMAGTSASYALPLNANVVQAQHPISGAPPATAKHSITGAQPPTGVHTAPLSSTTSKHSAPSKPLAQVPPTETNAPAAPVAPMAAPSVGAPLATSGSSRLSIPHSMPARTREFPDGSFGPHKIPDKSPEGRISEAREAREKVVESRKSVQELLSKHPKASAQPTGKISGSPQLPSARKPDADRRFTLPGSLNKRSSGLPGATPSSANKFGIDMGAPLPSVFREERQKRKTMNELRHKDKDEAKKKGNE